MKRKIFWIYITIIILLYLALFFYIKNITGKFVIEPPEKINFDDLPESFTLKRSQLFLLDIDYKENYVFSDNTDLFDIDRTTGLISFTPTEVGEYPVVIVTLFNITEYKIKLIHFRVQP